ncbi:hypothetical protein CEXT_629551 [Caerostris extrusa]|uniref:Uncharacterized protein n=1 Tax=Caerostris extrusa TaxID=172846 RepID=A0AAV4MCN4_CAEEX|nr:hypothetical protein CEXT_629551 [Caerostris extrusa]
MFIRRDKHSSLPELVYQNLSSQIPESTPTPSRRQTEGERRCLVIRSSPRRVKRGHASLKDFPQQDRCFYQTKESRCSALEALQDGKWCVAKRSGQQPNDPPSPSIRQSPLRQRNKSN